MNKISNLSTFVDQIQEFGSIQLSNQIDIFSYYLTKVENKDTFAATEVKACFDSLNLPPHSNISTYLNRSIKKNSKKKAKYFKKNNNFALTPSGIDEVEKNYLSITKAKAPTDNLFPQALFQGTREYIKVIAQEASVCYDNGLFNACSVLIRRLLETLIIESFERKGIESKIKGNDNNYFFLSDLISICSQDTILNISRNSKQGLAQLKNLGDLSAHSRRYIARKNDLDQKKESFRVVFEELLHIIDYPNWK